MLVDVDAAGVDEALDVGVTADASLASHVEHTAAVTEHGAEVLAG
jgi:methionine aminopeptidase